MAVLSSSNNKSSSYESVESNTFDFSEIQSKLQELISEELTGDDSVTDEITADYTESASSESTILSLTGTFGKYPVTVSLRIKGSDVTGSYYYTKSGSGSPITLEGFMTDPTEMTVSEMVGGQPTGSWNLSLLYQSDNRISASGKMINSKGKEFDIQLSGTCSN